MPISRKRIRASKTRDFQVKTDRSVVQKVCLWSYAPSPQAYHFFRLPWSSCHCFSTLPRPDKSLWSLYFPEPHPFISHYFFLRPRGEGWMWSEHFDLRIISTWPHQNTVNFYHKSSHNEYSEISLRRTHHKADNYINRTKI